MVAAVYVAQNPCVFFQDDLHVAVACDGALFAAAEDASGHSGGSAEGDADVAVDGAEGGEVGIGVYPVAVAIFGEGAVVAAFRRPGVGDGVGRHTNGVGADGAVVVWLDDIVALRHDVDRRHRGREAGAVDVAANGAVGEHGGDAAFHLAEVAAAIEVACHGAARQGGAYVVGDGQRQRGVVHVETAHVVVVGKAGVGEELVLEVGGYAVVGVVAAPVARAVVAAGGPAAEVVVGAVGQVLFADAVERCAAVAGTEIGAEGAGRGHGGDCLAGSHVAELGPAAVLVDVAVGDCHADVAGDGLGGVDAAAVEVVDVGAVYLPRHVAVDLLLSGPGHLAEAASADVALGIVRHDIGCRPEHAGEVEAVVVAAGDGDGRMRCFFVLVGVDAVVEHLEPCVAAQVDITGVGGVGVLVGRHNLFVQSSLQDERRQGLVAGVVVFKLVEMRQACVGHLEPSARTEDADARHAGAAVCLLRHAHAGSAEEVEAHRTYALALLMLVDEAVVWLVVAVEVGAHDGERQVIVLDGAVVHVGVVVPHQHQSVVVHRVAGVAAQGVDGVGERGVHRLAAAVDGVVAAVGVAHTGCGKVGGVAVGAVVGLVVIGV